MNMHKIALAIACMIGQSVFGDITCIGYGIYCPPPVESSPNQWSVSGRQTVDIETPWIAVRGDDLADIVTSIHILSPGPNVSVPRAAVNVSMDDFTADIGAVQNISAAGDANMFISLIDIKGDLGVHGFFDSIQAKSIRELKVGGNCYSDIFATSTVIDDNPTSVQIDLDWVSGSYTNRSAPEIDFIRVGGSVGSIGWPVFIWSATPILEIAIGDDFYGQIGDSFHNIAGHPDIDLIEIGGDFIGGEYIVGPASMTMNSLGDLVVGGDFDANVIISSAMPIDSFYYIGGTFASTASITLPADGLLGQIVINSGNTSDDWLGNVIVGSTTLAEDYTTLSYELGDGAVATVPFNFHQRTSAPASGLPADRDCNPFNTELVTVTPVLPLDEVVISHYGPVYVDGAGEHFTIEFKSDIFTGGGASWVDVSDQFEVVSTNTNNAAADRDVVIEPKTSNKTGFEASGRWRIQPKTGKVKCGDVTGNPDVVYDVLGSASTWYTFRVGQQPLGVTVLDGGNGPELSDLTTWLAVPYETNADGETNSQDFIDMANEYQGE